MNIFDKDFEEIDKKISEFSKRNNIRYEQVISLLIQKKDDEERYTLPYSIFSNENLSCLETIVKYLKENLGLSYKSIGLLLNRNPKVIAITYHNSKKKMYEWLSGDSEKKIPLWIFRNRKISVLENIVAFLKENEGLRYKDIALILRLNERTIWTVYNRYKRKVMQK